ncbi:alpha/beta fold hydrolase [Labrys monachus]|uniref:Pimeloyl-ACP methyl ester carboxylesterase n=1 Tax=Labrys monachus TaxID=217067 RepID=A0ABU0FDR0_9HYPH|nr:alpha/beta hydrolase [Labrys monachus]MDQ0392294.1 pimeloyl-ACP methyl ester carboxylesterase [Labrys monachus]
MSSKFRFPPAWRALHGAATLVAFCLAFACLPAAAQTAAPAGIQGPVYTQALGIGLESWPYPYPVHFMPVEEQGQALRMAYMDVAPSATPNGRTALLFHGKNFDSSYWRLTIEALAGAGYRVVVPDQIGFNKSSKPEIDYSFDVLAANTARLLDSLHVSDVDLIGHSTGGMLAVRFARTFPSRIRRLVLEDPIGLEDYRLSIPPQTTRTLFEAERNQTVEQYRAFIKRYFPVLPASQYEPFVEWRARIGLSGEFDRYAMAVALTYQMIYRQPVRYEYRFLEMPMLMMVGGADRTTPLRAYAPPEVAARMGDFPVLARDACAEARHCRLVVFPGLGHVPHLEAPDAFNQDLLAFLRE